MRVISFLYLSIGCSIWAFCWSLFPLVTSVCWCWIKYFISNQLYLPWLRSGVDGYSFSFFFSSSFHPPPSWARVKRILFKLLILLHTVGAFHLFYYISIWVVLFSSFLFGLLIRCILSRKLVSLSYCLLDLVPWKIDVFRWICFYTEYLDDFFPISTTAFSLGRSFASLSGCYFCVSYSLFQLSRH